MQSNICVSLVKKTKPNYQIQNLDLKDIHNNKFLAIVKLLFSDIIRSAGNIFLDESEEITRNEEEVKNIFNEFFVNIVPMTGVTKLSQCTFY